MPANTSIRFFVAPYPLYVASLCSITFLILSRDLRGDINNTGASAKHLVDQETQRAIQLTNYCKVMTYCISNEIIERFEIHTSYFYV